MTFTSDNDETLMTIQSLVNETPVFYDCSELCFELSGYNKGY